MASDYASSEFFGVLIESLLSMQFRQRPSGKGEYSRDYIQPVIPKPSNAETTSVLLFGGAERGSDRSVSAKEAAPLIEQCDLA
jgi:hypothetical protein